jgi:preprotein translocase subunit SecG
MDSLHNLVVVVQVISALVIIALVLMQHGKGADMGAAFGSGASGSLFGATGSSNFMSKSTGFAAAVFFISTLVLANFASQRAGTSSEGLMEKNAATAPAPVAAPVPVPVPAPAAPAAATPVAPVEAPAAAPATTPAPVPAPGK